MDFKLDSVDEKFKLILRAIYKLKNAGFGCKQIANIINTIFDDELKELGMYPISYVWVYRLMQTGSLHSIEHVNYRFASTFMQTESLHERENSEFTSTKNISQKNEIVNQVVQNVRKCKNCFCFKPKTNWCDLHRRFVNPEDNACSDWRPKQ